MSQTYAASLFRFRLRIILSERILFGFAGERELCMEALEYHGRASFPLKVCFYEKLTGPL